MEIQILLVAVGALVGAIATYLYNRKSCATLKDQLYDKQLVNKFLKDYLHKNKNKNKSKKYGKAKYYKKQHATKAGNQANKPS